MTAFPDSFPVQPEKGLHTGRFPWIFQRLSGLALVPSSIWFLIQVWDVNHAGYDRVYGWLARPWAGTCLALFITLMVYHNALGLQVIMEDYVSHPGWQKALVLKVKVFSFALAALAWGFVFHIILVGNGYFS